MFTCAYLGPCTDFYHYVHGNSLVISQWIDSLVWPTRHPPFYSGKEELKDELCINHCSVRVESLMAKRDHNAPVVYFQVNIHSLGSLRNEQLFL